MTCTISETEWEDFLAVWDVTPCSEYGMCEDCPFAKEDDE